MEQKDIEKFAEILERAGYEEALPLIVEDLIPIAKEKHISLWDAARQYANCDEEQDTSWYQLFQALLEIPRKSVPPSVREPL